MYGKAKTVEVRAVFNSKAATVAIRKIVKKCKPEKVKIVFTLKPKYFAGDTGDKNKNFEIQFHQLLTKLLSMDMDNFIEKWFGVNETATTETN